jgi:hypothetical protein
MYKQRLNVKKKIQNKFLNLIKLLFPWKYRFAFHSVPIFLVPSTEMSHMFSTEMSRYRVVPIPFRVPSAMCPRFLVAKLTYPMKIKRLAMSNLRACFKMNI